MPCIHRDSCYGQFSSHCGLFLVVRSKIFAKFIYLCAYALVEGGANLREVLMLLLCCALQGRMLLGQTIAEGSDLFDSLAVKFHGSISKLCT